MSRNSRSQARSAARLAAEITGTPRKALYAAALRLAGEQEQHEDENREK